MEITTIGGGTGTTAVLSGLKKYKDIHVNAIISMMDDGGSNAVVRDQFGLLPLSDLRKAIIALSDDNENQIIRKLFNYRFSQGDGISGHTLGNLIMVALSDITGSEYNSIKACLNIFDVRGDIIPVTLDKARLVAQYKNGKKVFGEHKIDVSKVKSKVEKIWLSNEAVATPEATNAILHSEFIVIGPGDLYTSLIPNIIVKGINEAIKRTKGKIVYITNLMSKQGETESMTLVDLVNEMEKYLERKIDIVLVNNGRISKEALKHYLTEGQKPFADDLPKKGKRVIRADIVSDTVIGKEKGDTLSSRSILRHDPEKLGAELYSLFRKNSYNIFIKMFNISNVIRD